MVNRATLDGPGIDVECIIEIGNEADLKDSSREMD